MTEAAHVKPELPRDLNDNHVDVKTEWTDRNDVCTDAASNKRIQLVIPEPKRLAPAKVTLGLDDISRTLGAGLSDQKREAHTPSHDVKPIYPYPSYPWPLPFLPGIPSTTGYPIFPYPPAFAAGFPYNVVPEYYNQLRHLSTENFERYHGNYPAFPYMVYGSEKPVSDRQNSPLKHKGVSHDVVSPAQMSPVIDGENQLPTDLSIDKSRCVLTMSPVTVNDSDKIKSKTVEPVKYQCSGCDKNYSTFSGLSKHKQFHCVQDNKKEFTCKYCDKCYVSLGALKMHIRTHTLPCKCKICGKAFSRPWLLQGHVRTHTGEKPFTCIHCLRAFADRSNLRAHLQTHSDVKKYSCKTCSKTFSRMSLLLKHEESCSRMC